MVEEVSYREHSDPAAENYQRYFVPTIATQVSRDLLEKASLRPGERVLDVACGTGIIARLAAKLVGAEGRVVGTDVAPDMIQVARSTPVPPGAEIEWREADAASLPLPDDAFDVVLCQMGLPFIEERDAALREMRRVLAPGGLVVLNTPGGIQRPLEIMGETLRATSTRPCEVRTGHLLHGRPRGGRPTPSHRRIPGRGCEEHHQHTQGLFARGRPLAVHQPDPDGGLREPSTGGGQAALTQEYVDGVQEFLDDDSVTWEQPMVVATGRA